MLPGREQQSDLALNLLYEIRAENLTIVEPPHWLAEAASVVARVDWPRALEKLSTLWQMEVRMLNTLETYSIACRLSHELKHHLFDTLYHAVALAEDSVLVTADERYYNKARRYGNISLLADFSV